ncbi:MAG: GNAT family N-acetyltransferase [Chloroflexota bacterium]
MLQPQILKTQRLLLSPLTVDDAADLHDAYRDPETMRFMPTPPHTKIEETRTELQTMLTDRSCYWAIQLADTEQRRVIGHVGYLGNPGVPGMGYFLARPFWRQGYMMEAVHAALRYGFQEMDLEQVELWINGANIASQGLARKVGFARRGQFRMRYGHQSEAHDKVVYGLYRHEWEALPTLAPTQPYSVYSLQPVLAVPDVESTANFYRDLLEFTIDFFHGDPPEHGAVSISNWMTEGVRIQLSKADGFDPSRSGIILYIFVGPDIDERYARYQARGVTIHRQIETHPWGMREFSIKDCNGYILRFGTSG